jgi:hypothetical protein
VLAPRPASALTGDSRALVENVRMPAYQSIPELDLSAKYHLKAIGCEHQAKHATDQATEQEWRHLAIQWHSMADQAATMSDDSSRADFR